MYGTSPYIAGREVTIEGASRIRSIIALHGVRDTRNRMKRHKREPGIDRDLPRPSDFQSGERVSGELLIKRRWVYETGWSSRIARGILHAVALCGRATTERGMNAPLIVVDGKSFELPLQVQTIPD